MREKPAAGLDYANRYAGNPQAVEVFQSNEIPVDNC